jgi:RHS repeat-associated protein
VWSWDQREPFGIVPPDENPSGLGVFHFNLRFPGQYFDRETITYYNGFRDYAPGLGRYTQSDPIGLDGGLNTYAHVGTNPISRVDRNGEIIIPVLIGAVAIVAAADLILAAYNFYLSSKIEKDLSSALADARNACAAGIDSSCNSVKQLERELTRCTVGLVKSGAALASEVGSSGRYPSSETVFDQIRRNQR